MRPRILLLHASAGSGHRRAAEALASSFQQHGADATVCDILSFTPPFYRTSYAAGYLRIVKSAPELWGYMYDRTNRTAQRLWRKRIRTTFNKLNTLSFRRFVARSRPDALVCTHFLPLELLSELPRPRPPLYGVLTDYAVHALWICPNVDRYYVPSHETRRQLIRAGQPESRIAVTGIPVEPAFSRRGDPVASRRRLGLAPDMPTILFISGTHGMGPAVDFLEAFRAHPVPCQIVVVAGMNEPVRARCAALARTLPMVVAVHGFVENVHEFMDAADIVVGKSGGLTSAEILARGKPLLVVDPIPGQEQRNCEYLLENGCAARLFEIADAPWKIESLLADTRRLKTMADNARQTGCPQAGQDIVEDILADAERRRYPEPPRHRMHPAPSLAPNSRISNTALTLP